jgi:hypothetical protein
LRYPVFVPDGTEGTVPRSGAPVRLEPRGDRPAPIVFRQGAHAPYAIRWYGITSLFGHFRNFIASAVATESVDARDWMRPQSPRELLGVVTRILGAPNEGAETLTEAFGRPVWIDFVADTGDDRDVSLAVGRMIAPPYEVEGRTLPRGDLLIFGGDIAYPVATADEIFRRLVAPWNEAFAEVDEDPPEGQKTPLTPQGERVVLAVPGNHDWYDGLDGFARLFRRVTLEEDGVPQPSPEVHAAGEKGSPLRSGGGVWKEARPRRRRGRKVGLVAKELHLDEVGGFFKGLFAFFRSVLAFSKGVGVKRLKRLTFLGYAAAQEASYFILPLAPGLDMWGADRQLGRVDFRQRIFFQKRRRKVPKSAIVLVTSDPATAFGEPNEPGMRILSGTKLNLARDKILYLTGDMHHYERRTIGRSMHVIAGGGGAFLHGTRISPPPAGPPDRAYPNAHETRQLVARVPINLMLGRSGFLVHFALALVATIELGAALRGDSALVATAVTVTIALSVAFYLIAGHQRAHPRRIAAFSVPFAVVIGLLPMVLKLALPEVIPTLAGDGAVIVVHAILGAFVFGLFLATVAIIGLEHQQAFAALGHPGFKHFMRLCVHPDGRVEGWAIGKDDPLAPGPPVMIDRWEWEGRG